MNHRIIWFLSFLLVHSPSSIVHSQSPLTLQSCYQLALKQNETVATSEQDLKAAEAKYAQAIGKILPKISYKATEFLQDAPDGAESSGVGGTFNRSKRGEMKFNAKQPLFSGFREFHGLSAAGAGKRRNRAEMEEAKRQLFLDVAKAFYAVMALQNDFDILKEIETTLNNRLKELHARVGLGKSRVSELKNIEAELATQSAALIEAESALAKARDVLTFFIGAPAEHLADEIVLPETPVTQENFAAQIADRPDVIAVQNARDLSKALASAEKADRYPTLNAEANYYTYRIGFQRDIKWDALLTLDVPLFQGGEAHGKIQEAKINFKKSELALSQKMKTAKLEIQNAAHDFDSAQKQFSALQTASAKSKESFKAEEEDYRLGLVNNLGVLQSLRSLEEAERNSNRALFQAKINYLALKVAAGEKIP